MFATSSGIPVAQFRAFAKEAGLITGAAKATGLALKTTGKTTWGAARALGGGNRGGVALIGTGGVTAGIGGPALAKKLKSNTLASRSPWAQRGL